MCDTIAPKNVKVSECSTYCGGRINVQCVLLYRAVFKCVCEGKAWMGVSECGRAKVCVWWSYGGCAGGDAWMLVSVLGETAVFISLATHKILVFSAT